MSSGYEAQLAIVDKLVGAGIVATMDPRSATPPCVLVAVPDRDHDVGCGYTAQWELHGIVPGPFNADAAKALSDLADAVEAVLPVERTRKESYVLSQESGPMPSYRFEFSQGV